MTEDIPDGASYKKQYDSWFISDYRWLSDNYTAEEFRKKWFSHDKEFDWLRYRLRISDWKTAYRHYIKMRMK